VENVRLLDRLSSRKAALGTLYLTATHVIFVENGSETRKETWVWIFVFSVSCKCFIDGNLKITCKTV